AGVVGAEDLDEYGQWSDIPQYGHVWSPTRVEVGWQPYRAGRWGWQDPWGWTWIADEPWGWAPYHYGRWINHSSRWFWVPVAPGLAFATYSPALVAFVGGGPGWSASFSIGGGGYMGWFPLAPRDPFVPWWGSHERDYGRAGGYGNVTNVTYVNRNYVTVVNREAFVSGGAVSGNYVRDASVIRQVASAPVLRGALPVMPAAGALRISRNAGAAARPPVQVSARPVVTRLAPPPAPPSFRSKVAAIREQRGAPVTAAVAARLSIQGNQGARAVQPIRPAAAPSGRVTFRPRSAGAAGPRPQAVTAPRGKVLATADRPIVATPGAAARPEVQAPARIAPNAVVSPKPAGGPGTRATQQPLAPRGQGAPSQDRQTNAPPKRTFGAPPPARNRESNRPAVPQSRSQQPLAPRGQSAPSQDRQTNAPPKRSFEAPPARTQESNRPEVQQRRPSPPLPPRGENAPAPDRQKRMNNPPPTRSFEAPPPRTRANDRQASPERRSPPQTGPESRPSPRVNRSAPPPPRQSASPDRKPQQKKPDTRRKRNEPATTSEPPPPSIS
ncbi:MAG TPA: DUF6600 domain-containing protein, partial [Thermoanaerobaculia bacterium]|nr:DUF6600 domain-containing protein [Thermoanaerobaculia bacterium]